PVLVDRCRPGGLVPGHGRAVAGLVPARLPEPARPGGQAAALPTLVGGWRLARPGVQPVPPQAGPQRHLAGQRPRPAARAGRHLAPAPGGRAARLVVAVLPGLGPRAQHHHRGRPRRRRPDAPRPAPRAVRALPALGRHADPGRPAHRALRPARPAGRPPHHRPPGRTGRAPRRPRRPRPPLTRRVAPTRWRGRHRTRRVRGRQAVRRSAEVAMESERLERSGRDPATVAREIIDANRYMTLATADGAGRPWAAPVWYAHRDYHNLLW